MNNEKQIRKLKITSFLETISPFIIISLVIIVTNYIQKNYPVLDTILTMGVIVMFIALIPVGLIFLTYRVYRDVYTINLKELEKDKDDNIK